MDGSSFLKAVLGLDGALALRKARDRAPVLDSVLLPRTIVAWLGAAARLEYVGEIPGIANSQISLAKSEDGGLTGAITVGSDNYPFRQESLLYVAAALGVALGVDNSLDPSLRGQDLSKLGKSIDLLVRGKLLTAFSAPPAAEAPSITLTTQKPSKAVVTKSAPKPPKEATITKSDSERECEECGGSQFAKAQFVGCVCWRSLAKGIKTTVDKSGSYLLKFTGADWDDDAVYALVSSLKGKS